MPELEELMQQIGELRASLIKIKEGETFTDPAIKIASQMLDAVFLSKYQEMLMEAYSVSEDHLEDVVEEGER